MKKIAIIVAIGILGSGLYLWNQNGVEAAHSSHDHESSEHFHANKQKMTQAALGFLESLSPDQREKASFEFKDEERYNFHYIPRERLGLSIEEMDEAQRQLADDLLLTALSQNGLKKVKNIMSLELVLREVENRGPDDRRRHPEKYYMSIFGEPSDKAPWGWRYEGHHLSLNFSSVTGEVAISPAFWGSNPGKVMEGKKKDFEVLKAEQAAARTLVNMLTKDQLKKAMIADAAPEEILTAANRKAIIKKYEGLKVEKMTEEQKAAFANLMKVYADNLESGVREKEWAKIEAHGMGNFYFAWAGSLKVGEAHYYRIHGGSLIIEYDNIQNNANHVHAVWRNTDSDFGEDLLKKHYETSPHHKND